MLLAYSFVSVAEKSYSVHGSGEHWDKEKMCVTGNAELEPDTTIKIIRKGILRYRLHAAVCYP